MIIDIKQIEDVRAKIVDLSSSIRDLVINNKEYFSNIEKHIASLTEISNLIQSLDSVSGVKEQVDSINNTVSNLNNRGVDAASSAEILKNLGISAKKASDRLEQNFQQQGGPAQAAKKGIMSKEADAVRALVTATAAKLMIPLPGNMFATAFRWMIHGAKDAMNIQAGAGQIQNILVGAYEGASKEIVASAKQKLSNEQVMLERFYGINKEALQSTLNVFAKYGVGVSDMERTVDSSLGLVGDSLASFATAVDLRLNVSSGTTARGMVDLVTNYNEDIETARKMYTKLLFLGRESGVGPENFAKNVMAASNNLTVFGVSAEHVSDMMLNLQERIVKMGIEKQFAGKFVAEGMSEISGGLANLSDNWKSLIAEKMGWGIGVAGLVSYDDQLNRLTTMSKGERKDDFSKLLKTTYETVKGLTRGERGNMYLTFKDQLGYGQQGAQLMLRFGEMFESGDIDKQHDIEDLIRQDMKDTLVTEKEKQNQFQLLMNQWLTYVGQIGRGILALLMDLVMTIMRFMENISALIPKLAQMSFKDLISGKAGDLIKSLDWKSSSGLSEAGKKNINEGIAGAGNVMKLLGQELAGEDSANKLYASMGLEPAHAAETHFVMVPVSGGSAMVSVPSGASAGSGAKSGGGKYKSMFDKEALEPLKIVIQGVDEQGNISVALKGDCPRCGLHFGEGSSVNTEETSKAKTGTEPGKISKIRNVNTGRSDKLDLSTPSGMSKLSEMSVDKKARESKAETETLDPRLGGVVQGLEKAFPGKDVQVYRGSSAKGGSSQHSKGKALDIGVKGVPTSEVFKHLRKAVPKGGVGYYPNQPFVHVDVRDKSETWVDTSKPGEKSITEGAGKNVISGKEADAWIGSNLGTE